ncbi:MAG TPA: Clp protease N-terminal domain-containing protein [Solirubrobacteraceae bacterium]|nr:Clp protease N-terminal domain-containing protein [Solirubrobacteraceae bacterium]
MTRDHAAKRAVRARMAATGEKYTEARRDAGGAQPPAASTPSPEPGGFDVDPIGAFTDQGYNAILLAEDEARMLGQPLVEPEHLLLAASRHGNVQRLLLREGIDAGAIHATIVAGDGRGSELVFGRVPRSAASDRALVDAVSEAFTRGITGPSTEHLLLGLARAQSPPAILGELGLPDPVALVNAHYPDRAHRTPLDDAQIARRIAVAGRRDAPRPGPMPPIFERFLAESREAIEDAVAAAGSLKSAYVTPAHLMLGLLDVPRGAVAKVSAGHAGTLHALRDGAAGQLDRPTTPTTIFSPPAREIVAEGTLAVVHRLGDWEITAGHLLLAVLESPDSAITALRAGVPGSAAVATELEAVLARREGA